MSDVDKLIADAEAVTNGDDARIDVMMTRMEELASIAADTIHTGLLGIEGVRAQHGIEALAGMAWLVGRLAAFADHHSGNTRTASMATIGLMIQGGYDEWVATKPS